MPFFGRQDAITFAHGYNAVLVNLGKEAGVLKKI